MTICGIIAEYNPFHLGHAYHLAETRRRLGGDAALVCAMSGNFVQRGDFAIVDKYDRAAMAVEGGADLVVELPLPAALSSAERFAAGGVSLLAALGCGFLSFGAECGEVQLLQQAADLMAREGFQPLAAAALRDGMSYPAAVQHAAAQLDPQAAALLSEPNNTLGIAYCAAIRETGIRPMAVPRTGAGHDSQAAQDGFASASYLRARITEAFPKENALCDTEWRAYLPEHADGRLSRAVREGRAPMLAAHCDTALLSQLRRLGPDGLREFASSSDGFCNRLLHAIQKGNTFEETCAAAQTRRYPLARVRRTLLRAYLGLPEALPVKAQYIRVLALSPRGAEVLRQARLPVIVKPAAERGLPEGLQPALGRDALADALYALAAPSAGQRSAGARWKRTPFVRKP